VESGGRVHLYSPDFKFVRQIRLPGWLQSVSMSPAGDFVYGGSSSRDIRKGMPFHIIDKLGGIVRSFGPEVAIPVGGPPGESASLFILSEDRSALWHWTPYGSRIEAWRLSGEQVAELDVTAAPGASPRQGRLPATAKLPGQTTAGRALVNPPMPSPGRFLQFLRADGDGRAWFLINASPEPLVYVVDIARNRVVTSFPRDRSLLHIEGSDLMYSSRSGDRGEVTVVVERLRVEGGRQ
jgi:hypothetical protein